MFDDNRSFIDFDNSFLLQSDCEQLEIEPTDQQSTENNLAEFSNRNELLPPCLDSTDHSAHSERISNNAIQRGYKNPKYKPICDNGITYTYEKDPCLYRKIRK